MQNHPLTNIYSALSLIDGFTGRPEEFVLAISDALQDPMGVNMALITDKVLERGWLPAGFEQKDGYRLYRYSD